jgi:ParB/RepB/Spo0J family partition protein
MSQLDRDVDHDAIIEDAAAAAGTLQATARMDVRLLVASRTNPREIFDPAKLRDLADSIEILDILEPIIVRKLPAARMAETAHMRPRPTHEIVAGERRYRGALLANLTTVPYVERELTDQQVLDIQLVENLQREDLSPLEEAKGYKRLVDEQGVKAEAIGKSIGRSRAYVYNTIRLLTLTQEARDALLAKTIDRSKAELLAAVGDPKLQLKALKEFTESTGWHDRHKSHKECKTWLEQNVLLKLKDAPFDTNAEDLLPGCGSCQACPKRTHADRDIFAAFDGPDMCTDSICWHDKDTAHLERIRVRHEADGCEVIAGKAAKKLKSAYGDEIKGYTRLDAKHDDGDGNLVTIGKLLGKDAPKPVVFVDPVTHKAIKVLPTAVVGAKLKEKGLVKETQAERTAKQEAARAREQAKQRIQEEARARATREIAEKIGAGVVVAFSGGLLRALIVDALTGDYHQDRAPLLQLVAPPRQQRGHPRQPQQPQDVSSHTSKPPRTRGSASCCCRSSR